MFSRGFGAEETALLPGQATVEKYAPQVKKVAQVVRKLTRKKPAPAPAPVQTKSIFDRKASEAQGDTVFGIPSWMVYSASAVVVLGVGFYAFKQSKKAETA